VRDQFARLAGVDLPELVVEELPGGLLGWRTRVTYAIDAAGRPGLHRHRSHEVQPIERCLIGGDEVGDSPVLARTWPGISGIEVNRGDDGAVSHLTHRPAPAGRGHGGGHGRRRGRRPPDRVELVSGPERLARQVLGQRAEVAAAGFWQVHPAAVDTFARAVLDAVRPAPGERVLDLYAGAGALTGALADAVGPSGRAVGFESAPDAAADANRNLAGRPWAEVRSGRVDAALLAGWGEAVDVVVLDPPRAGAGVEVMRALLDRQPRVVGYVSCDPATLARDVAVALDAGWRLGRLRAFDAFPMTHHVECVAALHPATSVVAP
jgi:tRNA/tmRNA/rRNA uracil-C5-methylase (TrmA/RlmC/RlmD family)